MQIEKFYTANNNNFLNFSREQASRFAKEVANDFNPIHDLDAKRFCVPGDLLFSVALTRIGLCQKVRVNFADMVTDGVELQFPEQTDQALTVTDSSGKTYMTIQCEGGHTSNRQVIESLLRAYVEFSGTTFPHILVPLWKAQGVMINPTRPLVIYESMAIDLDHLNLQDVSLELAETSLEVNGKRGNVRLCFNLLSNGEIAGRGEKRMVLSGLREYDQAAIDGLVDFYNNRKPNAS